MKTVVVRSNIAHGIVFSFVVIMLGFGLGIKYIVTVSKFNILHLMSIVIQSCGEKCYLCLLHTPS